MDYALNIWNMLYTWVTTHSVTLQLVLAGAVFVLMLFLLSFTIGLLYYIKQNE